MGWSVKLPLAAQRMMPRLIHASARFTRPLTMGVRAALLRDGPAGTEVFLVRHSYVPGWHLPGGAVEAGETVEDSVAREVREECAIAVEGRPELFGLYFNRAASARDHIALFRVREFRVLDRRSADWEIAEAGFYPVSALPQGTTKATRARLAEMLHGQAPTTDW
jgi:ADP-ribose pyrophosphatase YjhB (NUDIX family)